MVVWSIGAPATKDFSGGGSIVRQANVVHNEFLYTMHPEDAEFPGF